jgi:Fe-S cluster assembly protein SufB
MNSNTKGVSQDTVKNISATKGEPQWMLNLRLKALETFYQKPLPIWGSDLSELNFDAISYYFDHGAKTKRSWNQVPKEIKITFDRLGIPKAEQEYLAGVSSQFDSEVIYGSLKENLKKQGVVFSSMDEGLKYYSKLVKQYFSTLVSAEDNKFAALNTAVWSGGTFLYVPKGVKVTMPLQAYFWINSPLAGQFERTLIILEESASVHYIEGCSAPRYTDQSLHSGVVEIFVGKNARCQYSTIQNWSTNVYNLVTKKAIVYESGEMFWVDGNFGSLTTMKYPACLLKGKGAHGEMLSVSMAAKDQCQDTGAKMIHLASNTTSAITSKSLSKGGGKSSYRGLVYIDEKVKHCHSKITCNSLILDDKSSANAYPDNKIRSSNATVEHEATVSKIEEEQLLYLMSRGFSEKEANTLIVSGFIEPVVQQFPLEYAVELNRLIELEMEGNV